MPLLTFMLDQAQLPIVRDGRCGPFSQVSLGLPDRILAYPFGCFRGLGEKFDVR